MKLKERIPSVTLGEAAARELERLPDHRRHVRLLAISKCAELPASEVARFFDVSPETIRRWVKAYSEGGVYALENRPRGHRAAMLGSGELRTIGSWLRSGTDARGHAKEWTLAELCHAVQEEFGIKIGVMPLWRHLKLHGYWRYLPYRQRRANGPQDNYQ